MTLNYTQIFNETLKNKFEEMVHSGRATGGNIALAALKEQLDNGDDSELGWVVQTFDDFRYLGVIVSITRKLRSALTDRTPGFTKDNGPCHKLVTTPEHAPVIMTTLEDLKKSRDIAQEKGCGRDMKCQPLAVRIFLVIEPAS